MKTLILYPTLLFLTLIAASTQSAKNPKTWFENKDVPGIQFLDPEFGIDRTEVTNFNWCEYMYWMGRTYGLESRQYKSTLPDSTLWSKIDTTYQGLDFLFYLRHPDYRNFPVVGVTHEQAINYCNWRSDRVFEYMLIRSKLRKWEDAINADTSSFLSVERYKNGTQKGLAKNPKIDRLPHYRLPTEAEWNRTMKYNAALLTELSKRKKREIENAKGSDSYKNKPIPGEVYSGKRKISDEWIFYLDQNVSEFLDEPNTAIGQNWGGTQTISDVFNVTDPSVYVGFRCAFEWIKPE